MLTVLIQYWAVGWSDAAGASALSFFQIYTVLVLIGQIGVGFGLAASAVSPTIGIANSMLYAVGSLFMLFGGFFANNQTMPPWLAWLQWISPARYGHEAFVRTQFEEAHGVLKIDLDLFELEVDVP